MRGNLLKARCRGRGVSETGRTGRLELAMTSSPGEARRLVVCESSDAQEAQVHDCRKTEETGCDRFMCTLLFAANRPVIVLSNAFPYFTVFEETVAVDHSNREITA